MTDVVEYLLAALEEVDGYLSPYEGEEDVYFEIRQVISLAVASARITQAYKVITPYVEPTNWQAIAGELAEALEVYGNGIGHSEIEDGGNIALQALTKYNAAKDKT